MKLTMKNREEKPFYRIFKREKFFRTIASICLICCQIQLRSLTFAILLRLCKLVRHVSTGDRHVALFSISRRDNSHRNVRPVIFVDRTISCLIVARHNSCISGRFDEETKICTSLVRIFLYYCIPQPALLFLRNP